MGSLGIPPHSWYLVGICLLPCPGGSLLRAATEPPGTGQVLCDSSLFPGWLSQHAEMEKCLRKQTWDLTILKEPEDVQQPGSSSPGPMSGSQSPPHPQSACLPSSYPSSPLRGQSSHPPSRQLHSSNFLPINQALNFLIICLQGDSRTVKQLRTFLRVVWLRLLQARAGT